jgi:hypothetical protein
MFGSSFGIRQLFVPPVVTVLLDQPAGLGSGTLDSGGPYSMTEGLEETG